MTRAEFRRRTKALAIQSRALSAAELVLCDGLSLKPRAHEAGVSVATLSKLCKRIRQAELCETCGQPTAEGG